MDKLIIGPISLYHLYNEEYGMDLYIFADYHKVDAKCGQNAIIIDDYIKNVINLNKNIPIDIYLETAALISGYTEKTPNLDQHLSYIQDVVKKFESCLEKIDMKSDQVLIPKKCNYNNIQVHPVDFRTDSNIHIWFYFLQCHKNRDNNKLTMDDIHPKEVLAHVRYVIQQLQNIYNQYNMENPIDLLVKLYDIGHLMENEYSLVNPTIKKSIHQYLDKSAEKLIPGGVQKLLNGLKEFEDNYGKIPIGNLADSLYPYIEAETWILDYYAFAKIFAEIQVKRLKFRAMNIVYYAGFYHVQSLLGLLKKLNFSIVEKIENKNQCLDVSKVKQPFWKNNPDRCMAILQDGSRCENDAQHSYCNIHKIL